MIGAARHRSLIGSIVVLALALAAPLLVVTALSVDLYVKAERHRLEAVASLTGDGLRERVDRDLAEMISLARALATSPAIDAGDFAGFDAQARSLIDLDEVTVTLSRADGRQVVNTRVPNGATMPTVPRPEIVARLVKALKPVVSPVLVSAVTGREIVLVSAPVIRDGAMPMFVSLVVRLKHFSRLIERQGVAGPYSAKIIDESGRVLAHAGATSPGGSATTAKGLAPAGAGGETIESARSVDLVHPSGLSDWTIVTGIERAALEAPLWRSLAALGTLAIALVGAGGAIAWAYGRRIGASASVLVAAARTIGRGEPVVIARGRIREANVIGEAMAAASLTLQRQREALDEANARLEERVAERGRELDASRTLYQLLAENMTDMVILRRIAGATGYVSPSSLRLLGHAPAAFAQRDLRASIHPDDLAAFDAAEASIGPGQPAAVCLFRARRADGGWIWIEAVNDFLASAAPGESNVISTWRDCTDRREQAEELRMARDSAELAQAKAENASRAKSDFILMMNQEIRTPLTTIKGLADLLMDTGALSPDQRRYLDLVTDATTTLLCAVDDILDFAKSEAGALTVEAAPFALVPLIERVIALAGPAAERRGVALTLRAEPPVPAFVMGDERRLRQALLTFVHEAIDVARSGAVTIAARGPRPEDGPETLILSVTPTIARGESGRSGASGGVGLPLARRLVGLMGGRIEAEADGHRLALPLPATGAPKMAVAVATDRPARILVAEDSLINQEIARALLERCGHLVDVVDDGEAAVAAVQAKTYDLVLMDVMMPVLDGIGATRRIRGLQHPSRRVPIVAMTANVMPNRLRAFAEAGMSGALSKPFDRKALTDMLAAQLSSIVLLDADDSASTPSRPAIFERASYDALRARLGADGALGALRGFIRLLDELDAAGGDGRAERDAAAAVTSGATRLGFHDLANAYGRLIRATGEAEAGAALRRCRVARDLARRTLDELTGPDLPDVSVRIALL